MGIGKGIESKDINTDQIKEDIKKINGWKKQLQSRDNAKKILETYITEEMQLRVLASNLVRYEYEAFNFKIDGVNIGNFKVSVSFDLNKVNLIGMHIIKELYTKIFSNDNHVFLLAKKNTILADEELDSAMDELKERLELLDQKIF